MVSGITFAILMPSMFFEIKQTIRDIQRAREIVTVLIQYGFTDVVQILGIDSIVHAGRRRLRLIRPDQEIERLPRAVRMRKALEELGPTFIKMAQVLSTRPDLIPVDWAREFSKLQDDVSRVSHDRIKAVIEGELGDRIESLFESIDFEPLAAASIAQVHRAVLKDGTAVVLKVQRPGVRKTLRADMELLTVIAGLIESRFANTGYSPVAVVEQFSRELRREIDFTIEGRSTDRMRRSFKDDPEVHFPCVFWEATTPSVLCLEYIEGTPLSKRKSDEFTAEELERIVSNGARGVFQQCLEIGFFHADPHPGNIIVMRDAEGNAGPICFIDCGMAGNIDPQTAQILADITLGTVAGELDHVIDAVIVLADADPAIAYDRSFRSDVWEFISHFQNADFTDLKMGSLLQEFFDKIREHHLRCPADIVFLIKAITTIEGIGEELCPEYDIVEHVRPSVEQLVRRRYGIRALRTRLRDSFVNYAELAESVPKEIRYLATTIRKQRLTMNLEHRGLDRLTQTLEHASRNIARALLIASLIGASAVLILADRVSPSGHALLTIAAIVGFVGAGILFVGMLTLGRSK